MPLKDIFEKKALLKGSNISTCFCIGIGSLIMTYKNIKNKGW